MRVPGQAQISYTYDNANRLTQITQGSSIVQFGYDNANRRTSLTLPNNILVEYAYDAASRVTAITYKQNGTTAIGDLTYEYDKAGNRTKIGGSWARTGMPEPITTTNYDVNNRQLTFGDKSLAYDDNGNLQSITDSNGTTLYNWNARNQLVGISGPSVNASFVYDGIGRREKKTINGSLTEFLYDGINPVQESSGAAVLANILSGPMIDEFLTRTDVVGGTTSNFLTAALGSPIAVADASGTAQTEYTYEPFGKATSAGGSNSSSYQYTGRENDGTGLYYYRARYFEPSLQRFISEDPILSAGRPDFPYLVLKMRTEPQQLNGYSYVANNPVHFVDPYGLWLGQGQPNGNEWPGYTEQNWKCDPPFRLFDKRSSCTRQCCIFHDACFQEWGCNWTSVISLHWFDPKPPPCTACNFRALICFMDNYNKSNCPGFPCILDNSGSNTKCCQ
jgi:RHS repeat-associated protein